MPKNTGKEVHFAATALNAEFSDMDACEFGGEGAANVQNEPSQLKRRLEVYEAAAKKGVDGVVVSKVDACFDLDDGICQDCAIIDPRSGNSGHVFWDELEMKRHGYADAHGHHHHKSCKPRDEIELRHDGTIDGHCHRGQMAAVIDHRPAVDNRPAVNSDSFQHVHFSLDHCEYEYSAKDDITSSQGNLTDSDCTPLPGGGANINCADRKVAQSKNKRLGKIHEFQLDGNGELKVINMGTAGRAIYMKYSGNEVLLHRGPTTGSLMTSTVDPHNPGKTFNRCLSLANTSR